MRPNKSTLKSLHIVIARVSNKIFSPFANSRPVNWLQFHVLAVEIQYQYSIFTQIFHCFSVQQPCSKTEIQKTELIHHKKSSEGKPGLGNKRLGHAFTHCPPIILQY